MLNKNIILNYLNFQNNILYISIVFHYWQQRLFLGFTHITTRKSAATFLLLHYPEFSFCPPFFHNHKGYHSYYHQRPNINDAKEQRLQ